MTKCLTCPAPASCGLFCAACDAVLYPDWRTLYYQPRHPVTDKPLKGRGPDGGDYFPLRLVAGEWRQVPHVEE